MTSESEIIVTLPGGRRVDAQVGGHIVHTDQPKDNGGEDLAPSPFDLFLASLGTCAGIFVQGFCAKRGLPCEGIRIVERPAFGADGVLSSVDLDIELPPSFPEKYREALVRVAEQCSVKRAIAAQPVFTLSKELEALLNESLAQLPPASREVLVLRDVEGLTAPEVAEVLGVSVEAVKSKLHRARSALHELLAPKLSTDLGEQAKSDCPDILAMYSQQLEGDLTGALCAKMEKHVAHCARCSSACDALKKSLALCKTLPVVPEHVKRAVRSSFKLSLLLPASK